MNLRFLSLCGLAVGLATVCFVQPAPASVFEVFDCYGNEISCMTNCGDDLDCQNSCADGFCLCCVTEPIEEDTCDNC